MDDEIAKQAVQRHPGKIAAPFEALYERLGFEGLSVICELYGGSNLYIPSKKRMVSQCIYEEIKNEQPGANIRDIVHKYSVCERTARNLVYGQK